jgi:hypothetical protein
MLPPTDTKASSNVAFRFWESIRFIPIRLLEPSTAAIVLIGTS